MFLKRTNGDDAFITSRLPAEQERVRTWKIIDEFILKTFALASRFHQDEKDGLSRQIKKAAALCGARAAEWASKNGQDDDMSDLEHSQSIMIHLRYYIYLARRLNLIEQKDYFLVIRKHETALKTVMEVLDRKRMKQG